MVACALPVAHDALLPQLGKRPRPQRAVHRALREADEEEAPLVSLLRKRLGKLLPRHADALDTIQWAAVQVALSSCPFSWAWAALRTWTD
eukprot:3931193-Pyramimonas_sp.AAC.1